MHLPRPLARLGCLALLAPLVVVNAQTLPQPSRTVFRCEIEGKVTYSDAPCKGAQKVEVEPTRGLSTTGRERPGSDVQREHQREALDQAVRPLTGLDTEEMNVVRKRQRLSPAARSECGRLDAAIGTLERREQGSRGAALTAVQDELLVKRTRFLELRC